MLDLFNGCTLKGNNITLPEIAIRNRETLVLRCAPSGSVNGLPLQEGWQ
jgi:hypothetical protein